MNKILTIILSIFTTVLFGQYNDYVPMAQYQQLLAQCADCMPTAHNQVSVVQPIASGVKQKCVPQKQPTLFRQQSLPYMQTISQTVDLYFVKIAAVKEDSQAGGMPAGSFRVVSLGEYVASQGYHGVFMGPYYSDFELYQQMEVLEGMGFCDMRVEVINIELKIQKKVFQIAGVYE